MSLVISTFHSQSASGIGGPVAIVQWANQLAVNEALLFLGAVSISLGLFNSLPIRPFDGGHITAQIIEHRFGMGKRLIFDISSSFIGLGLLLGIIISDVFRLI